MTGEKELWVRILQALSRIESKLDRLDEIANLLRMGQKTSIEQTRVDLLEKSKLRRSVYKLCDGRHTVSQIAQELGKPMSLISQSIAKLVAAGLISEERKGKQKFYKGVV